MKYLSMLLDALEFTSLQGCLRQLKRPVILKLSIKGNIKRLVGSDQHERFTQSNLDFRKFLIAPDLKWYEVVWYVDFLGFKHWEHPTDCCPPSDKKGCSLSETVKFLRILGLKNNSFPKKKGSQKKDLRKVYNHVIFSSSFWNMFLSADIPSV